MFVKCRLLLDTSQHLWTKASHKNHPCSYSFSATSYISLSKTALSILLQCIYIYTFSISLPATSLIYFPSFCVTPGIVSSNIHSATKELFVQIPNNSLLNSLSANYGGMPFFLIIKKTEPMNYKVPDIHILTD